jgi:ABC-type glycerol-3-phosphate transport system permease component
MRLFRSGAGQKGGRTKAGGFAVFIVLVSVSSFLALPFAYSIMQSLKPIGELLAYPPRIFARRPTLDNYSQLFRLMNSMWIPVGRFVFNSLFVSIGGTALYTVIASMAAYPLAFGRFKGKSAINEIVVNSLLFTSPVLAASQYLVMAKAGLLNTYFAMVIPTLALPLGLFLMRQFMAQMIPWSLIEAASIDGAGSFITYSRVVMPIVKPAWITLIIFTFQTLWSGTGSTFVYEEAYKTLPTVLSQIAAEGVARMGVGSAAAVVVMLPPIALFLAAQNRVVETMSASGIK